MQFREEETEGRGLHGRLDGHGARFHLPEAGELREPVSDDAADEMEEEDGNLWGWDGNSKDEDRQYGDGGKFLRSLHVHDG